jgi:hypothetical protein
LQLICVCGSYLFAAKRDGEGQAAADAVPVRAPRHQDQAWLDVPAVRQEAGERERHPVRRMGSADWNITFGRQVVVIIIEVVLLLLLKSQCWNVLFFDGGDAILGLRVGHGREAVGAPPFGSDFSCQKK